MNRRTRLVVVGLCLAAALVPRWERRTVSGLVGAKRKGEDSRAGGRDNGSRRRPKLFRRRGLGAAVGVAVALAGAVPALATFTNDPVPSTYAGSWVLFYNDALAGPVRNVSGCTTDNEYGVDTNGNVFFLATKPVPCVIETGLTMSPAFRTALVSALKTTPTVGNFAIGRLSSDGSRVTSEVRLRGYISDVVLPRLRFSAATPDPSWMRVELVSSNGTLTKVNNPTRTLNQMVDDAINTTAARLIKIQLPAAFSGTFGDPIAHYPSAADPVLLAREDVYTPSSTQPPGTYAPGRLTFALEGIRVADGRDANAAAFENWMTGLGGRRTNGEPAPLLLRYPSSSRRGYLELSLSVRPAHFDPYPRTDNLHLLKVVGAPSPLGVSWTS